MCGSRPLRFAKLCNNVCSIIMRFINLKPPATSSSALSASSKNTRYSSVTSRNDPVKVASCCAAPRLPVAEPVYSAEAVYDQVRESTVLAVDNAKHAVGMA